MNDEQAPIPNYLVQSILVTIFCCLPTGIAAIVFAAGVNGKAEAGDLAGAQDASAKAKMWCWISFGIGIVVSILTIAVNGLGLLAAVQAQGG